MTTAKKRKCFTVGFTAFAFLGLTSGASAGNYCPRDNEVTALKAAAIQQELMVAALTCQQTPLYNRFVVTYRKQLQRSDTTLHNFFLHRDRRTGTADYHAYKTRLANKASLRSLHDGQNYCQDARAIFKTAFERKNMSLASLVVQVPLASPIEETACSREAMTIPRAR